MLVRMTIGRYVVGTGFCIIAAFIYCVNYAVAASCVSIVTSWPTEQGRLGAAVEAYSSGFLTALAVISFLVGIAFIFVAEWSARRLRPDA
jgi:hypothetical protein